MTAVFKREFKAYFHSPLGYIVLAALTFFSSTFFRYMYSNGYGDMAYVFSQLFIIVMLTVPVLTMRLFSEDRRQKVDQALLCAPVGTFSIVFGKFLAAFAVFAIGYLPTLIFQTILSFSLSLNWLLYFSCLLGALLYGAALISVGMFISSLTESQAIAGIMSIVASLLIGLMDSFASMINNTILTKVVGYISFSGRYETFANGILDFSNIIFFASVIFLFLFLSERSLERKRWA